MKIETASIHRLTEDRLDLFRPGYTAADYAELLACFYGFYEPWERAALPLLREWDAALFAGRAKTAALAADLTHFGINAASLPLCQTLPRVDDLPLALGSAYVLEGATLGGQFLSNHFRTRLGLDEKGLQFYTVYGSRTGSMWKSFRDALSAAESLAPAETFVGAAQSTFEALGNWLMREPAKQ